MREVYFFSGILVYVLILIIDILVHGFVAAFKRANFIEISKKAEDGDSVSIKLEKISEDETMLNTGTHITALVLNCVLGVFVVDSVSVLFHDELWITVTVSVVAILLTAVVGIVVPGKAVSYHPDKWVYQFFTPANVILTFFMPITWIAMRISDFILLILGKNPDEETDNVTEDEIITIVNEGQEQGLIEDSEAEMITKIIEFGDKQASDIMTHRVNIGAIDCQQTLENAVKFMLEGNNSRYPVYDNDINNIVGILHIKDAIKENVRLENRTKPLVEIEGLFYEPEFIPETRNINDLFKFMQTEKIHMAIVVDEYGQTSGIVTMEDILEEIVGNIQDEHDEEEEMIKKSGDNTYIVDGMSLLEDLEDELSISFSSEYNTINGFMTGRLGKIPTKDCTGFSVEYEGYIFTVTQVGHRVFDTISIMKIVEK